MVICIEAYHIADVSLVILALTHRGPVRCMLTKVSAFEFTVLSTNLYHGT